MYDAYPTWKNLWEFTEVGEKFVSDERVCIHTKRKYYYFMHFVNAHTIL